MQPHQLFRLLRETVKAKVKERAIAGEKAIQTMMVTMTTLMMLATMARAALRPTGPIPGILTTLQNGATKCAAAAENKARGTE